MITCPKCNKELSDGTNFCDSCGAQIPKTVFCSACGQSTNAEFAFCKNCGAPLNKNVATETPVQETPQKEITQNETPVQAMPVQDAPVKEKAKFPKKTITVAAVAVAAVLVLVLLFSLIFGGNSQKGYAFYVKDGEMFVAEAKKKSDPWQLTERLAEDGDADDLASSGYQYGRFTTVTKDGKYVFFPDKISDGDSGFNLYYKEVNKPKSEAVKVDSDVRSYKISSSANLITYVKGDDKKLYQCKIGKDSAEKIASDVQTYSVSKDGKRICYFNSEESVYLIDGKKEKEKIASDITNIAYINDDLSVLYYIKDEALYKQVIGKDKEKIASDIKFVINVYESGEVYYVKNADSDASLMDFVDDDMKAKDDAITEPKYPTYPDAPKYPSYADYGNYDAYSAAYDEYKKEYDKWQDQCDKMREEYSQARSAYYEKQTRDRLRENIKARSFEYTSYTLCYYNGNEEIVITDSAAGSMRLSYTTASDKAVISYEAYSLDSFEKVKLSEITTASEVETAVKEVFNSSKERYIAIKETPTLIEQEKEIVSVRMNSEGTVVFYVDNTDDDDHGDLYCVTLKNKVGTPEIYDTDVYSGICYFTGENDITYFKNYKESSGDMFINKNEVDADVYIYSIENYSDMGKTFYMTDWDSSKSYGTLRVYNGKKAETVADEANDFYVLPDETVLYMTEFSTKYYKGELNVWNNGKTRKIDDDVSCIVHATYLTEE